jgi:hypothetical protein
MSTQYASRRVPRKQGTGVVGIVSVVLLLLAVPIVGYMAWYVIKHPIGAAKGGGPLASAGDQKSGKVSPNSKSTFKKPAKSSMGERPYTSSSQSPYSSGSYTPPPQVNVPAQNSVGSSVQLISEAVKESLKARPTLVVWLFDQSKSNANYRSEVAQQLPGFYRDLIKKDAKSDDKPLLTAVAAYSDKVEFLTEEPTDDVEAVTKLAGEIKDSNSSVENTFTAIHMAAEKFAPFKVQKGRLITFVVVSDEVGDDHGQLDEALKICNRYTIPVYVVGISALSGRQSAASTIEGPATATENPVRQGPETRDLEVIDLEYPRGNAGPAAGDSGFGPYYLSQLCLATDGKYFAIPLGYRGGSEGMYIRSSTNIMGRTQPTAPPQTVDPVKMRQYAPKFMSDAEYLKVVNSNKALQALLAAAKLPRVEVMHSFTSGFETSDEAGLRRSLDSSQRPIARIQPPIEEMFNILKAGESDAGKLTQPRWQAEFYLALGRAMAAKARADGYLAQVATLKNGKKFEVEGHTHWELQPADEFKGNSTIDSMRNKAAGYLNKVITEHPGTTWAVMAQQELSEPIGWKWTER